MTREKFEKLMAELRTIEKFNYTLAPQEFFDELFSLIRKAYLNGEEK